MRRHRAIVVVKDSNDRRYIIDNYERLPQIIVFKHANRYQWHVDDPLYDGQRALLRLQLPFVYEQGYVNLRCVWTLGCPAEIHPLAEQTTEQSDSLQVEDRKAGSFYKAAFEHLFPNVSVPSEIGVSGCAEFAVTAWKIKKRPKSDYQHYRAWLMETPLPDSISGRIFEYLWHSVTRPLLEHDNNTLTHRSCLRAIFHLLP